MLKKEAINKPILATKKLSVQRQRILLTLENKDTYLTTQETNCICCLYQGLNIKEAAANLSLSKGTVGFYLTNILKKTRFNSTKELMTSIKKLYTLQYFTLKLL